MAQPIHVLELDGKQIRVSSVQLGVNPKVRIETGRLSSSNPFVSTTTIKNSLHSSGKLLTFTSTGKILENDLGCLMQIFYYTDFPDTAILLVFNGVNDG